MRRFTTMLAAGLLVFGYANLSTAQTVEIVEVTWTFAAECDPGLGYGADIYVDARGPSPGDIIISGSVEGCTPELGPFTNSSIVCNNTTAFMGVAMAVDRELPDTNMDTAEFTIEPCVNGSQTYDGTGGTSGTGGTAGVAGAGGVAGGAGTGGVGGSGGSGSGGSTNGDDDGGCGCTVQSAKLDYGKIGFGLLLIGVLVARRLRRRYR